MRKVEKSESTDIDFNNGLAINRPEFRTPLLVFLTVVCVPSRPRSIS
jgi:hypothetical protein